MIKSKRDRRLYRLVNLKSGLKTLLVNDPDSTQCAAAITVGSGNFGDPLEFPGLAHLLEHCLFMGSKNFPEENHVNQYLDSHGGHINAWTASEMTGFYLSCVPEDFKQVLDMFADMIAHPIFRTESINKEIKSIDSEFKLKRKDDLRRLYQVHKETCNPQHPFSKFSVGNAEVFNRHTTEELKHELEAFHQKHYRIQNMRFCLVAPLDLDELETLALSLFDELPKELSEDSVITDPLYTNQQVSTQIELKPLKPSYRIIVTFALDDLHPMYRSKPESLISHMLGYEGDGSLLSYFKKKEWATHLSAGGGIQGSNFKDFNLNLQVTEAGIKAIPDIIAAVIYYLNLIVEEGVATWRYEEKQQLNQLAFDYQDSVKPQDYAIHLATQMHHYPDEHIIDGEYLLDDFNSSHCLQIVKQMTLDNIRIKVIAPEVTTEKHTQWYDTPYRIFPLDESIKSKISNSQEIPDLFLPAPNLYLPNRVKINPAEQNLEIPQKLSDYAVGETWFGQDAQFNLPKGEFFITFESPLFTKDIETIAAKRIWANSLQEHFNDQFYAATVAGIHFHIYPHQNGFSLHTSGFSDKQLSLASSLLAELQDGKGVQTYFNQVRRHQAQSLQNSLLSKPINRLFTVLNTLMQKTAFLPEDLGEKVLNSDYQSSVDSIQNALHEGQWQALIYGDWTLQEATLFDAGLDKLIPHNHGKTHESLTLQLSHIAENHLEANCPHDDSALIYYLQAPDIELDFKAYMMLLEHVVSGAYFNWMRVQKQFGYQVGSGFLPYNNHPGLALYIQSPNTDPNTLFVETQGFLEMMVQQIANIPEDQWHKMVSGLVRQVTAKDVSLTMKCQRLWVALGNRDYKFNEHATLAEKLTQISAPQMAHFLGQLLNQNDHFVAVTSKGNRDEKTSWDNKQLSSVYQYKDESGFYF